MRESLKKLEADIYNLIESWENENSEVFIEDIHLERIDVTGHGRDPDSLRYVKCKASIKWW